MADIQISGLTTNPTIADADVFAVDNASALTYKNTMLAAFNYFSARMNVNQATSSATLSAGLRYICNNGASPITFTLPATAVVGDTYIIVGASSGGWTVAQNAGQSINFGTSTTTTGTGGSLSSSNANDCIFISCHTANTGFTAYAPMGNITVV